MPDIYANAPLAQTIFQARFHGDLNVEIARARIQALIREQLPKLFVPLAVPGVAPQVQPLMFKSEDESETFEIAINSFAYTTTKYPGYAAFKDRALWFSKIFADHVPTVRTLNRVGLRYVNRIPILRESKTAAIPLGNYLNVGLALPPSVPGANLTELNSVFTVRLDGGSLKVMLKVEPGPSAAEPEMLVLDFDFGQLERLNIGSLSEYLDIAHAQTKRVFTDLISESYMPVMRGEQ